MSAQAKDVKYTHKRENGVKTHEAFDLIRKRGQSHKKFKKWRKPDESSSSSSSRLYF